MTTVTALPTAPDRSDPTTFDTRADAWAAALGTWTSEVNTVAGEVNTNATNAATSASTATTQASNAAASASTATTQAGNASTSAGTATTQASNAASSASTASTQAGIATAQAAIATTKAAEAAASAASIAGGPVASVNGNTGVVTGVGFLATAATWTQAQTFTNSMLKLLGSSTGKTTFTSANSSATDYTITFPAATVTLASLTGTETLTNKTLTDPTLADSLLTRAMLKDCGATVVDKGNSGTSTQTYDYTAGSVQTSTATGNHTIATSNWPPTGNLGSILIQLTNGGAYTLTWPTISWIKPDGTTTTSISTYLAALTGRTALQTSGMDQILLWSRDAGTTIYGKLV